MLRVTMSTPDLTHSAQQTVGAPTPPPPLHAYMCVCVCVCVCVCERERERERHRERGAAHVLNIAHLDTLGANANSTHEVNTSVPNAALRVGDSVWGVPVHL